MAVTSLWKSHLQVGQGSTAKATCHRQHDLRIKIKCHSPYTSVPLHLHVTIIISNSVTFLVPKKYSYALSSPKFDKLLWDLRSDIFFEGKMEKVPGKMSSASMRTDELLVHQICQDSTSSQKCRCSTLCCVIMHSRVRRIHGMIFLYITSGSIFMLFNSFISLVIRSFTPRVS